MSGVWAGLIEVAVIFACGAITLTISYRANERRDDLRQYAAEQAIEEQVAARIAQLQQPAIGPHPDTQPGPLDHTYQQLEAIYQQPAAERRQP